MTKIVFLTNLDETALARAVASLGEPQIVRDAQSLSQANGEILLSFGTAIIVPPEILARFPLGAYNIHAASPEFPGRDPHHWAIYEGAQRYGSTLHVMTERVDEGPIIDVEWFGVQSESTPAQLLRAANEASMTIIGRIGPILQRGERLIPKQPLLAWAPCKRTRADFHAMCRISPTISRDEYVRRFRAFDGGPYDNLTVEIHGQIFRIEKS